VLGEVRDFDLVRRRVLLEASHELTYDDLIVAAGSQYSYFGHDGWAAHAPDIKSVESALEVRRRILSAFEAAELEQDPDAQDALLTFVVVGGGPTGVELAGQIAEIARDTLRDFRSVDTSDAQIFLVEMEDRILAQFPPRLSAKAELSLRHLGVTPLTGHRVVDIDGRGVSLSADGATRRVAARTVVWAAGVVASDLGARLASAAGSPIDRGGRVVVGPQLTLPGHPEVFVVGDMASVHDALGSPVPLPGLAPVAMQQGRYAARAIRARLRGRDTQRPFRYRDKGNLATIGRARAVADLKGIQLTGFAAWVTWLAVHLVYLVGFQNRIVVVLRWTFSFVTRGRGARLITAAPGEQVPADRRAAA
jgi:NADH dehydrogenase